MNMIRQPLVWITCAVGALLAAAFLATAAAHEHAADAAGQRPELAYLKLVNQMPVARRPTARAAADVESSLMLASMPRARPIGTSCAGASTHGSLTSSARST